MNSRISVSTALGVMLMAGAVSAHHGMSAVFDFNQRFTRVGTLTRVEWRNPHIYLFVDATSDDGQVETWAFEGPSPVFFRKHDVGKNDFADAVGKTVTVDASRARDGSQSGLIRTITLPEGQVVSLCPQNC